jgi:hypothetical protein
VAIRSGAQVQPWTNVSDPTSRASIGTNVAALQRNTRSPARGPSSPRYRSGVAANSTVASARFRRMENPIDSCRP